MSHSVDRSQKYLQLYQLRQAAIASTLHSNLAQPIVAAKNFAAAIMSIQGEDAKLKESQELAGVILEMTDQAYTVAYDLMRENEADMTMGSHESMQSAIERFGVLLRLNDRGIKLDVFEDIPSISVDHFVKVVVFDWMKALLIYLTRHTKVNVIAIKIAGNNLGLNFEITPNIMLSSDELEAELVFVNMRKQLQVLEGSLLLNSSYSQCSLNLCIPFTCKMITVIK